MATHLETKPEEECKEADEFSPTATEDGRALTGLMNICPQEADWVQIPESKHPKLKGLDESNPPKLPLPDAPTLSRALEILDLTNELGITSADQSNDIVHVENLLVTVGSNRIHDPLAPPQVGGLQSLGSDSSAASPSTFISHSSKKKKKYKNGKRIKSPPMIRNNKYTSASSKPIRGPHPSLLDVISKQVRISSAFERDKISTVPVGAAGRAVSPTPKVNPVLAAIDSEGTNKMETTDSEWIKLPRDEITGAMPIEDILIHLTNHGCEDVTQKLDIKSTSDLPMSGGGFGDVYRVSLRNGRQLAFKCIKLRIGTDINAREYLKRAAHELYVWSKCQHPNVLELIGVAQFHNQLAMVSPWLDNGDLKWFIDRNPGVDRCALCVQVADGVKYLHDSCIVHGDLKAANILVSEDQTVKITDFGNAVLAEYSLRFTNSTGGFGVSPRWTAPEILDERTKATVPGDIFALGMTILEIITGAFPYHGVKDVVVLAKIMKREHPERPQAHIPTGSRHAERLWSLLNSCWEYDSQKRPTARQVKDEMKRITPEGLKSIPRYPKN